MSKLTYTVPDYYPDFACKCGDCRQTCCHGWGITVSMQEYFNLVGMNCSPKLRRKLDSAFHIVDNPSPERYAMVSHNYCGDCPILSEDGWCSLQRELGEDAIPSVCRYYPRSPKQEPLCECCTSGSCEKTLELLFASDEPVKFIKYEYDFYLIKSKVNYDSHELAARKALRSAVISQITDRSISFEQRMEKLAKQYTANADSTSENTVELIGKFAGELGKSSITLQYYLPFCEIYRDKTVNLSGTLHKYFAKLDIWLEKLFVNHIFYKGLPDTYGNSLYGNGLADEICALTMAYAFAKYICAAYILNKSETGGNLYEAFVDSLASAFKIIEHSDFDTCANKFLRSRELANPDALIQFIRA